MPNRTRKDDARTSVGERRSSPRYRTRALTDGNLITDKSARAQSFLGTTVNVSAGGALVRTYEALAAGQEVSLVLHLPEGDLSVSGTVLHVEQDAVGCRLAGVRFAELGQEPANLLARHLHTFDPSARRAPAPKPAEAAPKSSSSVEPSPPAPMPVPDSTTREPGLRKAVRDVRPKTTVVFPFEGQIHRG